MKSPLKDIILKLYNNEYTKSENDRIENLSSIDQATYEIMNFGFFSKILYIIEEWHKTKINNNLNSNIKYFKSQCISYFEGSEQNYEIKFIKSINLINGFLTQLTINDRKNLGFDFIEDCKLLTNQLQKYTNRLIKFMNFVSSKYYYSYNTFESIQKIIKMQKKEAFISVQFTHCFKFSSIIHLYKLIIHDSKFNKTLKLIPIKETNKFDSFSTYMFAIYSIIKTMLYNITVRGDKNIIDIVIDNKIKEGYQIVPIKENDINKTKEQIRYSQKYYKFITDKNIFSNTKHFYHAFDNFLDLFKPMLPKESIVN